MQMKITQVQASRLLAARQLSGDTQKTARKAVFEEIRRDHGIGLATKIRVAVEDPSNPMYLVIRNKRTGMPLDNGIPAPIPVAVASVPVEAQATTVVKKPTAKSVKAKAPVKKASKVADDDNWPRAYRATIGGKRVRLGEALSAQHAKKLVAKYKKQHGIV